MKFRTLSKGIAFGLGTAIFLGGTTCPAGSELTGAATELSDGTAASKVKKPPMAANDVVAEWNDYAVKLTLLPAAPGRPAQAPIQQTRTMAIVQVSVHDAVNGITRSYETYLSPGPAPENASAEAAAVAAAYRSLWQLFPDHRSTLPTPTTLSNPLDQLFADSLVNLGVDPSDSSVGYGMSAADAIFALRMNDGSAAAQNNNYSAPGAGDPGIWMPLSSAPSASALLSGWGSVMPWVLRSGSQFRPEAPPALDSEQYAKDYNEIKEIGKSGSPTRTAQQTQIATFWLGSPTAIWNQVLRQVIATRDLDLSTRTRTFALVYLAVADSSVACWEAKYEYNLWRPEPAINRGSEDGNDSTAADAAWKPLFPTPRHPEYPSGHTTNSTAMGTIMQEIFGDDPGVRPAATIAGITREWGTFSEGLDEVIDARVYSGIHFRTGDEVGSRLGGQVARFVSTHALRPCRGNPPRCS